MFARPYILAAAAIVAGLNIGLAAGAAPAFASAPDGFVVSYADLNLASDAGRDILDRRIAGAAEQLCGQYRALELGWAAEVKACRAETVALTQPQRNAAIGLRGTVRVSQANLRVNRAAN